MKRKRDFGDKPYNRCLDCPHRQVRCDGPRTSAMKLDRWREFMRDMKAVNEMTNAEIADKAELSIKTVEQWLGTSKQEKDIMRETARRIEDAIIGSSNQYPCFLAFEESVPEDRQRLSDELKRALEDNKEYQALLDNIHLSYGAEMQIIRDEAQRKIDFLKAQTEHMMVENNYLRSDNERKGRVVDLYIKLTGEKLAEEKPL